MVLSNNEKFYNELQDKNLGTPSVERSQQKQTEILEKQTTIIENQTNFTKILTIATIILALTNILHLIFFFLNMIINLPKPPGRFQLIFIVVEMICIAIISMTLFVILIMNLSKLYPKKKKPK